MLSYSFEATGTVWTILVDESIEQTVFESVKEVAHTFEQKFSRFKDTSEIGLLNLRTENEYNAVSSTELLEMLLFGKQLQYITDGYFDVNVAGVLEGLGYDKTYSFQIDEVKRVQKRGEWKLEGGYVEVVGKVKFDLGAFGKGKLIDNISTYLESQGVRYYLVDGGRDFYGTSKADGSPWIIALEHPFDATLAIGEFPLINTALACSGISQRKVKDFHHFIDTKTHKPIEDPVGVFVVADTAVVADGVSTAIAVSPLEYISRLEHAFSFDYAVVSKHGELLQRDFEKFLY